MEHTYFEHLSSEDKVADIKARITNFKLKNPKLYPELQKKPAEKQQNDNRSPYARLLARS